MYLSILTFTVSAITTSGGSIFQVAALRFGKELFLMGLLPHFSILYLVPVSPSWVYTSPTLRLCPVPISISTSSVLLIILFKFGLNHPFYVSILKLLTPALLIYLRTPLTLVRLPFLLPSFGCLQFSLCPPWITHSTHVSQIRDVALMKVGCRILNNFMLKNWNVFSTSLVHSLLC